MKTIYIRGALLTLVLVFGVAYQATRPTKTIRVYHSAPPPAPTLVAPASFHVSYAHAIVPYGVDSIAQLHRLTLVDPAVAKLYEGFDWETAQFIRLDGCRTGRVSYRRGDQVYYKTTMTVICNEEVITDQYRHLIRVKCGNRLDTPAHSSVDTEPEPTESELDTPVEPDIPALPEITIDLAVPIPGSESELPIDGWLPLPYPCCGRTNQTPTPETGTLLLTGLGSFLIIIRRRRTSTKV